MCSIVLRVRRILQWQPMWNFLVELLSGMFSLAGKFMIEIECLGESSTRMGDLLGSPHVAPPVSYPK